MLTPVSTETDDETNSDCPGEDPPTSRSRCTSHEGSELDTSQSPATDDAVSVDNETQTQTHAHAETSSDCIQFDANLYLPLYDLVGVSNHCGTLNGGHYIAHVDTNAGANSYRKHYSELQQQQQRQQRHCNQPLGNSESTDRVQSPENTTSKESCTDDVASRWMCFNDEHVSSACTTNVIGPSAYVLFYRLRES